MRLGLAAADATAPYQVPIAADSEHRLEDRARWVLLPATMRDPGSG